MPRHPRKKSESGYAHLIVRGIGKQVLFEEEWDYRHFLRILERFCLETDVKVCAYCLMENHVHLLVCSDGGQIPIFMKKLGVSYSYYFNKKYERSGHLFQDRYLSEPIEDDRYLMTAFRYILNNPRKAGICPAADYPWSSYSLYEKSVPFMDLTLPHELIGGWGAYVSFVNAANEDHCLEFDARRHDDAWAMRILRKTLGVESGTVLQTYSKEERNLNLRRLKDSGLTVRQIERLTGINRNIIQRA